MRASPCLNPACSALNLRGEGELAPERCPVCGGPVLKPETERVRVFDDGARRAWDRELERKEKTGG